MMGPAVSTETGSMFRRGVVEKGRGVKASVRREGGRWKIEGRMARRGWRDAMVERQSAVMAEEGISLEVLQVRLQQTPPAQALRAAGRLEPHDIKATETSNFVLSFSSSQTDQVTTKMI